MTRHRPSVIVLKLGTSSIVHEVTHQPLLSTLSALVETVVHLRSEGHKVVLVSSGAIGVGLKRMEMPARPKGLAGKQVSFLEMCYQRTAAKLTGRRYCIGVGRNRSGKIDRALG
jgi:hypothetical protein